MTAILRFAGQAKRSGAADTYAIARRELDPRDLGCLLLHLRRIDPDWRAPLKERRLLAAALLDFGVTDSVVVDQTEVSRTTLWRIRRELVDRAKWARKPALEWAEFVSNGRPGPVARMGRFSAVTPLAGTATLRRFDGCWRGW